MNNKGLAIFTLVSVLTAATVAAAVLINRKRKKDVYKIITDTDNKKTKPVVVAVGGESYSGKTTLINKIVNKLPGSIYWVGDDEDSRDTDVNERVKTISHGLRGYTCQPIVVISNREVNWMTFTEIMKLLHGVGKFKDVQYILIELDDTVEDFVHRYVESDYDGIDNFKFGVEDIREAIDGFITSKYNNNEIEYKICEPHEYDKEADKFTLDEMADYYSELMLNS